MPVLPVAEIRAYVKADLPTDLYGAVRLVTSTDNEAALAVNVLISGGGYKELIEAGLTITEATRVIAIQNHTPIESRMATLVADDASAVMAQQHYSQINNMLSILEQATSPNSSAAVEAAGNAILKVVGNEERLHLAHTLLASGLGFIVDEEMVVPDLPVEEGLSSEELAIIGIWLDDLLINEKIKVNDIGTTVYSSASGIRTAAASDIISEPSYFEFKAPAFIDPGFLFGLIDATLNPVDLEQQIGSLGIPNSYGISFLGTAVHSGAVLSGVVPMIAAGDVIGMAVKPGAGTGQLFIAINGVWIGDPVAATGALYEDLPASLRLAVSTYLAGAEHKFELVSDPNDMVYPVPEGYSMINPGAYIQLLALFTADSGYLFVDDRVSEDGNSLYRIAGSIDDHLSAGANLFTNPRYFEFVFTGSELNEETFIGVVDDLFNPDFLVGGTNNAGFSINKAGALKNSALYVDPATGIIAPWAIGDIIGVAVNPGVGSPYTGKVYISINGQWITSGVASNPETGINPVFSNMPLQFRVAASLEGVGEAQTVNFKTTPADLAYPVPVGYLALSE